MFSADCPDDHVTLLQSIFRAKQDVSGLPERLRFDEIDAMFSLVPLILSRIKLELHRRFGNAFSLSKRSFVHPTDVQEVDLTKESRALNKHCTDAPGSVLTLDNAFKPFRSRHGCLYRKAVAAHPS